jgi:hypothetical protein
MAGEFRKGMSTLLFGEAVALAAVLVLSPKARELARPYLVRGIQRALALGDELKGMVDEAKVEATRLVRDLEAERVGTSQH